MDRTNSVPLIVAGTRLVSTKTIEVENKWSQKSFGKVSSAEWAHLEIALQSLKTQFEVTRKIPAFEKRKILQRIAQSVQVTKKEFIKLLSEEAGKTTKEAEAELDRVACTFEIASWETTRGDRTGKKLDSVDRTFRDQAEVARFPIGPCLFVTPFNFPLNLAAHKIAPAIAVGCPFIWKPASATSLIALAFGEILLESGYPREAISILPCESSVAEKMVQDERISFFSFTGSSEVGWRLKTLSGKKKVALELGGNAAVIVTDEWDIQDSAKKVVAGAFFQAGQSCISVQRIFIQKNIYEEVRAALIEATQRLSKGTPDSDIGPLISEKDAHRVESSIQKSVSAGAKILTGGKRNGNFIEPTLLENVSPNDFLNREEIFGPVAILETFDDFPQAIALVNQSRFGLQTGLLIRDYQKINYAFENLEVGGVVIGDVPSFRSDEMPYGGIKDSGFGREGVSAVIEEMTEPKTLLLRF